MTLDMDKNSDTFLEPTDYTNYDNPSEFDPAGDDPHDIMWGKYHCRKDYLHRPFKYYAITWLRPDIVGKTKAQFVKTEPLEELPFVTEL